MRLLSFIFVNVKENIAKKKKKKINVYAQSSKIIVIWPKLAE